MGIIPYNKQIDGLRFIAVLGVMICHFIHFENEYIARLPFGQGVNLFFVLSGFLITKILLLNKESVSKKETSVKKFFWAFYMRRALRIFPIYYVMVLYLLCINFQNTRDVWPWLVSYTSNFYSSLDYPYIGSFHHFWSLAVEEQFYLVWPLLLFITPKRHILKLIIGGIVASLIFKLLYYYSNGPSVALNALPISCADSLCFGALIAYLHLYNTNLMNVLNKSKFLVGGSLAVFLFFMMYPMPSIDVVYWGNNFFFSMFAFFVVLKVSQEKSGRIGKLILENSLFVHLGKISYGIYLYHFFMPDLFHYMNNYIPFYFYEGSGGQIPFFFISSIVLAQFSWLAIEKPILALKKKYQYKKQ